ncbi:hypothetical protein [Alcaligenes phenolicus]
MPPDTRSIAVNRIAQEMAMHRVINKALVARSVLMTGLTLPEVTAAGDAIQNTQASVDRLSGYIDDLMYEARIRKDLTSQTALSIINTQSAIDTQSLNVPGGNPVDPAPAVGGRVPGL